MPELLLGHLLGKNLPQRTNRNYELRIIGISLCSLSSVEKILYDLR